MSLGRFAYTEYNAKTVNLHVSIIIAYLEDAINPNGVCRSACYQPA